MTQTENGGVSMASKKPVTIHYRKFSRPPGSRDTLEQLVRTAMNSLDGSAAHRLRDRYLSRLFASGSDNLFINIYEDTTGQTQFVFGDVLHFTRGHLQALCQTADPDAALVPVQQMQAPAQSEYVHSQMFWMIKGDHVFVIQSMSLRTAEFESYLGWLLQTKTSVFPAQHSIVLAARFDLGAVGGDLEDIKEIIVGGVAQRPPTTNESSSAHSPETTELRESEVVSTGNVDATRTTEWSTARNVLRELLGGDANVESLLSSVPADAELSVQVHIGFQTRKKKIDRVALKHLETGLRHLPDGQVEVRAKGQRVASDGSVRLHYDAGISLVRAQVGDSQLIGSLLDPFDVRRAMVEAYSHMVANGKIQEE